MSKAHSYFLGTFLIAVAAAAVQTFVFESVHKRGPDSTANISNSTVSNNSNNSTVINNSNNFNLGKAAAVAQPEPRSPTPDSTYTAYTPTDPKIGAPTYRSHSYAAPSFT